MNEEIFESNITEVAAEVSLQLKEEEPVPQYKIKIDKTLLEEFLLCEDDEVNYTHFAEIGKLMIIIMYKYYNRYRYMSEDICSAVIATMMERRKGFDPTKDAYNYLYTMARNEAGNIIYRSTKEFHVEDNMSVREEGMYDLDSLENTDVPPAVIRYVHYLTGEEDFTIRRISRTDVVDILLYMKINERKAVKPAPSYVAVDSRTVNVLYALLKTLLDN